jgi:hypothetical protein
MGMVTTSSSRSVLVALAALFALGGEALAAGPPPFDKMTQCLDGGLPYGVGTHMCTSKGIVQICLRADQTYGVKGIYTYDRKAKDALIFDKAHWIATTSPQCGEGSQGKIYTTGNPKR